MPANNTVIVTAKLGPGNSVSALPLTDVSELNFNFAKGVFTVVQSLGPKTFEFTDVATVSFSLAAGGPVTATIST